MPHNAMEQAFIVTNKGKSRTSITNQNLFLSLRLYSVDIEFP